MTDERTKQIRVSVRSRGYAGLGAREVAYLLNRIDGLETDVAREQENVAHWQILYRSRLTWQTEELDAEHQLADQLAEALTLAADVSFMKGAITAEVINEALDAWHTARGTR